MCRMDVRGLSRDSPIENLPVSRARLGGIRVYEKDRIYIIDDITTWGITISSTRPPQGIAQPCQLSSKQSPTVSTMTSNYLYNIAATTPNPTIAAKLSTTVFPAAPVNMGMPAEFVALPGYPPMPPDMLMMVGLVALLPASHEGTGTAERVTITSAGMPVGHPGLMVITEVAF
jgi:hypothetical protein